MKITVRLWWAAIVIAFCCSVGNAQLIYSNFFNGGAVTLNGTAPTVANSLLGGSSSGVWVCTFTNNLPDLMAGTVLANGTIATNPGCALLPLAPQPGCVYTMTASLTVPAGMPNWVAMGFTQFSAQTNNPGYTRFADNPPQGYALMDPREGTSEQFFAGPRASNASGPPVNLLPSAGTYILEILLNTTGANWTASAYVNGTQMGTNIVYGTNPTIGFAGIGQTGFASQNTAGIQWNYWALSVTQAPTVTNSYWAAPAAVGTGDGSSSANAAGYLNAGFWSGVQSRLQSANVTINLQNGNYNAGTLSLTDLGNPLHQLCLQAVNLNGAVFSTTGSDILDILGSQNIKFYGIVFTGPSSSWGVHCQPDRVKPCRNLEFSYCQLINLTNAYYGAMGLVNGVRDVTVDNCAFTNNTNGDHQHMIYGSHDIVGVVVTNCLFQDCEADYVRFRDDSEYCAVENCTFISTMSATAWPFISDELYNDSDPGPGNEFFGTYFQVSGNTFTYNVSGGAGPYTALHFSDSGYSPQSYDCDLTPAQASQLSGGSVSFQQAFLQTNMGIVASGIKMFGNTYNSRVAHRVDYSYSLDDDNAPYGGWQGTINLSSAPDASGAQLGSTPTLRNGNFDRQGLLLLPASSANLVNYECLFRDWLCSPKYTDILSHPGFDGTSNALRFDGTTSQYVYQWITSPGPTWTMDCLFAIGSAFTGTGTKFQVDIFHDDIAGGKVSLGVDNNGHFGIYNGGTFTVLPELGTVAFSVDGNGNGNYTDPGDTLNVYRLRIVGNYAASTPTVNLYTSDANSPVLTHQSLGRAFWVGGVPVSGQSAPETVAFYNYTAPVVLDQVALAAGLADQPPVISSVSASESNLIFSGTNGFPGDVYYLSVSTNLESMSWTPEATNTFAPDGTFSISTPIAPGTPQKFYRLQLQ